MTDIKRPNPALKALNIMVGTWDLKGHDLSTREEVHGRSTFEWLEGGFFMVHRFHFDYAGRAIAGIELIGYNEQSRQLKTHVYSTDGPEPLEYTWELDDKTFTNWFGEAGADDHYKGQFSEDKNTLTGQWGWPGGGYEATMKKRAGDGSRR